MVNNKAKVFIAQVHSSEWKGEVGLEVRTGREKGDGDGQKASGIGCRGDEKRMPNHSRLLCSTLCTQVD